MNIETHEPLEPLPDFPYSHVKVEDTLEEDVDECLAITIHENKHYLHQTTALSLYEQLKQYFKGLPEVSKNLLMLPKELR